MGDYNVCTKDMSTIGLPIRIDATTTSAKESAETKTAPKTGDSMPITVLIVWMLVAAGTMVSIGLKKN